MVMRYAISGLALALATNVHAGGAITYSATDSEGTVEKIIELRALPNGVTGAMVSYERTDGSRSLVEYAVQCQPMAYAYLGIVDENPKATPNPLTARLASDALLANEARPVEMIPLEEGEPPIKALASAVCA